MDSNKSYKKQKRDPPPVIDFTTCNHIFGNTRQKTEWKKHQMNLPSVSKNKYKICKCCGFEIQVD